MVKFQLSESFYLNAIRFATAQLFATGIVALLWLANSPIIPADVGNGAVILLLVNALGSPFTAKLRPLPKMPIGGIPCGYCKTPMTPIESECPACHAKTSRPIATASPEK
jgi:hypothetical protein